MSFSRDGWVCIASGRHLEVGFLHEISGASLREVARSNSALHVVEAVAIGVYVLPGGTSSEG